MAETPTLQAPAPRASQPPVSAPRQTSPDPGARDGPESASGNRGHSAVTTRVVPIEVLVKKLKPLTTMSEVQLIELVESYDEEELGGLSEAQWMNFCKDNRRRFVTLGTEIIVFEGSSEYTTIVVVNKVVDGKDTTKKNLPNSILKTLMRFLEGFVAGGIAGAVSKTVIAPGDRVKIIFQVDSTRHFSMREAFRLGANTVREFGILGLWIGNGATMLRVIPYAAITYASFDYYHRFFQYLFLHPLPDGSTDEGRAFALRFMSGALAGATATTFTYPLDLMRARFAARSSSGKTRLPSYRVAFREATAKRGLISLYGGLFPTLVGIMPYAGCSFACFETIKYYIVGYYHLQSDRDIAVWQRLAAGAFSGLVAQSATYPLDIVRRRMQVTPWRYRGVVHALKTVYKEEGLRQGLYKGLAMNWIKGPIATATSFTVNDLIKRRTRAYYEKKPVSKHQSLVSLPEAIVCGSVAAATGKFWTLPLDKLRITYQVGACDKPLTLRKLPRYIFREIRSHPNMWTSGHVAMMRVVPYGALIYGFFDVFRVMAERVLYTHEQSFAADFLAGGSAAAVSTFLLYPLDLLRTRVALLPRDQAPRFQSYFWLLHAMARRNGVRSLWEGCYVATVGVGLLGGIGFATYGTLKDYFECNTFLTRFAAGVTSAVVAQFATYPFSVMKRSRQAEHMLCHRMNEKLKFHPHPLHPMTLSPRLFSAMYRRMPFSFTLSSFTFGISLAVNDNCRDVVAAARSDMLRDFFHLN
ncbi:solute carrier family 25, member 42 [Strigomonas culicis]|uniref:Solute carrier family 25, member 42 n=1 Tax=Strigomonas culicis TaxID=28005 RepID=S9VNQ7_9TRYP|nr:solute carrier family 25, member 42 [Strigomonas culicis]|eukprot:EPY24930.1 solute carrier family 25, member 42 [Strigomonas culicis]